MTGYYETINGETVWEVLIEYFVSKRYYRTYKTSLRFAIKSGSLRLVK